MDLDENKVEIDHYKRLVEAHGDASLVAIEGKYLRFTCKNGHTFSRRKDSIKQRSKKPTYKIECQQCKVDIQQAHLPKRAKQPPLSLHQKVLSKLKTVTLVDSNVDLDSVAVFECSKCNTSYKMKVKTLLHKYICPVCKALALGEKCDNRILDKFGSNYVRTGLWVNSAIPTTYKCINHEVYYTKAYEDIIHTSKCGCPKCTTSFSPVKDRPTRVYYVRIPYKGSFVYKIGITQRPGLSRFYKEPRCCTMVLIEDWLYPTWDEALEHEQTVLSVYRDRLLSKGEQVLDNGGNTEIFYNDVLELDK